MKELEDKEQILMAYYAQYYRQSTTDDVKALDERFSQEIGEERYGKAMAELKKEGLVIGIEEVEQRSEGEVPTPMATNEGMLFINNVLNLQSDAVEDHQLDYLENNLETSGLELTLEPVKAYIQESIQQQAESKPNSNTP